MTAPATIREADAKRLFSAARRAGLRVARAKLTADGVELFFDGEANLPAEEWSDDDK